VTIYSEQGIGTAVKMYLPRSDNVVAELSDANPIQTPEVNGETILVVEDDPDVRTLAVALLSELGYEILEAADGNGVLKALAQSSRINSLFTDVVLPGAMNGIELASEVDRRRPGIGVLYTSGYCEEAIKYQGALDGDIELLNKPFRRSDFAQKIRLVLDKSKP
jgi:CheY-like chemotaxis protein